MSTVDDLLMRLGAEPVPTALAGLDAAVLAGVGRQRDRQAQRRTLALAGGVALLVGASGSRLAPPHAAADPLLGLPAAAPSHLLAD